MKWKEWGAVYPKSIVGNSLKVSMKQWDTFT